MKLFEEKKGLILKITNAVLLLWFTGATVFLAISLLTLVIKNPTQNYTYQEYETMYCASTDDYTNCLCSSDTCSYEKTNEECLLDYQRYTLSNKSSDYNSYMSIFSAFVNMLTVGLVIYFLNKEHKNKK